jgi:predicted O-methyltransferase YrrM
MKKTTEIEGWFNYEKTFDFLIDKLPKDNATFIECGAWMGKSSSYLCDNISYKKPNTTIYIVDSWSGTSSDNTGEIAKTKDLYNIFSENMIGRKFTTIKADSKSASVNFLDKSIDCIFIDMGHSYEEVSKDLEYWYPKVKIGGYIAGHDWSWSGVNAAVKEKFTSGSISVMEGDCWVVKN